MTAMISGYKFEQRPVDVYPKIWNEKTKTVKPAKAVSPQELHEILDTITLAVEAGVVSSFNWPQQFFASERVFDDFIEQLAEYDECFRITDQWWQALAALCEHCGDEEGFISTRDIADELQSYAQENGLLDWSESKTLRYSAEQHAAALYRATLWMESRCELDSYSQEERLQDQAVLSYCSSFADYPKLSLERRMQAQEEALALLAASKAAKPARAKKPAAKKAATAKAK